MNTALRRARPSSFARVTSRRSYALQAPGAPAFEVFNRKTKWLQKERAASNVEGSRQADYLKDEVAMRLCERLLVRINDLPSACFNWKPKVLCTESSLLVPHHRTSSATSPASSTSAQILATSPAPSSAKTQTPIPRSLSLRPLQRASPSSSPPTPHSPYSTATPICPLTTSLPSRAKCSPTKRACPLSRPRSISC